ncbi:hypothetical protein A3A20_00925 [Candidatus Wolfebacteria bacterium RIFCSPLOWO2_01_FULL_45_19]|uniref:PPM-type phosphatase domain-containing protein n=1 Tax=Candidatus Wolfebacteria bacterium RIFCSPLOWO2_01_FULL_45_19 TaxID=1802557 RepID=A0A1F8DPW1_9BACT|nr:MAG: hypothetical protein A3A20_00925 [Candidatus Wolfebacteria bacterium RIFCSPLOWO2_01_FULL_45_19]
MLSICLFFEIPYRKDVTMMEGYFTVASERGTRSYQEDRHVVGFYEAGGRSVLLLAVMDGHRGSKVAELCAKELPRQFQEALGKYSTNIVDVLLNVVEHLHKMTFDMLSGSTISLVVLPKDEWKAYVAILGDSPVIVSDREGMLLVSPEHNARTNLLEREAAVRKGAEYDGGYLYGPNSWQGLQMSRALGNRDLTQFLNREPEVYAVDLGEKSFVIVATDGIFDPGHATTKHEVERLSEMVANGTNAEGLVQDAVKRQTRDNATAIVWRTKKN